MDKEISELRHEVEILRGYVENAERRVSELDSLNRNERERAVSRLEERLTDLEVNMFGPNKGNGHVFFIKILWEERVRSVWLQRTMVGTLLAVAIKAFWPEGP